jgi:hypothetical protein
MLKHILRKIARDLFSPAGDIRKGQFSLEALENRECPAVNVFTGAGLNANWSNGQNWSAMRAPIATDDISIQAEPQGCIMDGNYSVNSLTMNSGQSLTLQGFLTVTSILTWNDGLIYGGELDLPAGALASWSAGTRSDGTTKVLANAALTFTGGPSSYILSNSQFYNSGTVTVSKQPVNNVLNFTLWFRAGALSSL